MIHQQPTQFGLIRHAATLWNEKKKIQGQYDSPLSERGKRQAAAWGRELRPFSWQRILCSDLDRALATAALINEALNLPVIQEANLREQDWGQWSGMTLAELEQKNAGLLQQMIRSGWDFRPPGGESRQEVLARCLPALHEAAVMFPGERILVICHEGVIRCLIYHLLGRHFLPEEPKVIQGFHLHLLECRGRKLYLEQMNRFALRAA